MGTESLETLSGIALLSSLPPEEIVSLERQCVWRRYRSGEQILDRDSDSRNVMFVVDGSLRVVNHSSTGREVAYAVVDKGGYFGELSAIDGEPRSASVVAERACLLAALHPEAFADLLSSHALVAVQVLRRLARIIRSCDDRIMDLSTLGAMQRVYNNLLRQAEPDPIVAGTYSIYPMPTQQTLASEVSTTRETVARAISNLSSTGIVERKGKTLYIRDRGKLVSLIERLGMHSAPGS